MTHVAKYVSIVIWFSFPCTPRPNFALVGQSVQNATLLRREKCLESEVQKVCATTYYVAQPSEYGHTKCLENKGTAGVHTASQSIYALIEQSPGRATTQKKMIWWYGVTFLW